jgi:hypothetical protein
MRKLATLAIAAAATLGFAATAMAGDKGNSGSVDVFTFDKASVSSIEPDLHAGMEATSLLQIGGIGDSEVFISASWDWNTYDGTDHPCALVEKVGHNFSFDVVNAFVPWNSTAVVAITDNSGAIISAIITGGSVCEVAVPPGGGSNNEWNINFEVTGGTGRFAGASGTGTIHFFFDSTPTGVFGGGLGINEVLVHIN